MKAQPDLFRMLRAELSRLKTFPCKMVAPITRDPETGHVTDATGKVRMICGPDFWEALRNYK